MPQSGEIKTVLLVLAFLIVASTLWYTHDIVQELQAKEKQIANLYAKGFEYIGSGKTQSGDYSFVLDEIIKNIDFPIISTDVQNEPLPPYAMTVRNVDLDTSASLDSQHLFLKRMIVEMDGQNPPIKVQYNDTLVISYVHYGESRLIKRLRMLPYIEFTVVALFIFIGYMSFSYIKRSEQSNIWVGMARETAHQLGTPISSMMGWIELLKHQAGEGKSKMTETLRDMDNDLQRLQKIADRFSKIGSKPDLKEENIAEVIDKVLQYFQRRIPQTGKRVQLSFDQKGILSAQINRELFEWVIENLVKNALDAIDSGEGKVTISISERPDFVYIDVTDNGKGIEPSYKKEVFRPGFSTKKRGWGLGLSLSQRIIESYHRGKLTLKESRPGVATTFRIKLKR
ncbi:MAG TPA: sensor histidine kinase [Bacteroidetes bacterium]|nr:sensor histidine kinase [Bacteroidota bacterium]